MRASLSVMCDRRLPTACRCRNRCLTLTASFSSVRQEGADRLQGCWLRFILDQPPACH